MRTPDQEELCHERLAANFAQLVSGYDTMRRVNTLTGQFLTDSMVVGKKVLDVGCGLGFFSERLVQRGANVTACDIGPRLVEATRNRAGCQAVVADALELSEFFGAEQFDLVVSSECIEHTPDPCKAVAQMLKVLKPQGFLSLSTPNMLWYPLVRAASLLKLRPYDGHENFSTFSSLRRVVQENSGQIISEWGLHLYPFQFGFHKFSEFCDKHLQVLRSLMINLCILAQKR